MFWGILYQTIFNKPTNTLKEISQENKYSFLFTSFGLSLNRFFPIDHCFTFELRRLKQNQEFLNQTIKCYLKRRTNLFFVILPTLYE